MTLLSLPARPLLLQRVLWLSVALCIVIISMSMVMFGWSSIFVSPAAFVFTIAFDATLLVLSLRERQRLKSNPANTSSTLHLPATCRTATTSCSVFLVVLWLATFFLTICLVALDITFTSENPPDPKLIPATYVEIIFMFFQILTLIWFSVLSVKERKSLRAEHYKAHPEAAPATTRVELGLADGPLSKWLGRLIWLSVALCAVIFGLAMASFGQATLYLSFAAVGLTWIWCATIFILSAKERRTRRRRGGTGDGPKTFTSGQPVAVASSPNPAYPPPTSPNPRTPFNTLPCTSRKATIITAFLLVVIWAAAFVTSVLLNYWRFAPSSMLDFGDGNVREVTAWAELGFITPQFVVMIVISVLCVEERKRVAAQQQRVGWWDLGAYRT